MNFKFCLRWLAVLPGALITGFLATFPLHWILGVLFALHGRGEEVDIGTPGFFVDLFKLNADMIEYFLYPAVIAATFIIVGSKIAPKHKIKTAIVLFVIYVIVWSIASLVVLMNGNIGNTYTQFSGRTIFALLGAIAGLFEAKRENKKERTNIQNLVVEAMKEIKKE